MTIKGGGGGDKDLAVHLSCKDKHLILRSWKLLSKIKLLNTTIKRIIFFVSQPEILVAIARKEKSYTDATITLI